MTVRVVSELMNNLTFIRRSHVLKAGVTVIRNRKDQNGRSNWLGSASFDLPGGAMAPLRAWLEATGVVIDEDQP